MKPTSAVTTAEAMTVSGLTITSAERHWLHIRDSQNPQQAVRRSQRQPRRSRAVQHQQLVAQGDDLELERSAHPALEALENGEKPGDHR